MTLRLTVDGEVFEGWISARVDRALNQFAHSFSLTYLDRWAPERDPWQIIAGAACVLRWNNEILITGFVNRPNFSVSAERWQLTADGRSKTGDLVDSSAVHLTGSWKNKSALEIVQDLCDPFGIPVSTTLIDTERFKKFALQEGETVHSAINRVCKIRALLPITRTDGSVELFSSEVATGVTRDLPVDTAIDRTYTDDDSMRHSEYLTRATGVGNEPTVLSRASALDTGIKRYRPLVVVGDAPAGTAQAELRAIWESNVRYGRGERLRYVFQGVDGPDGSYKPGQRYRVRDQAFGVDLVLMVARASII